MKKMLCLLLALLLLPLTAWAEDQAADTLTLDEVYFWAESYRQRALTAVPLNDPEADHTEEGYKFVYEFATLYADAPVMSADTAVYAVVVTTSEEEGPRGLRVDDDLNQVTAAFYTENPELNGSYNAAVIYAMDMMPESYKWAEALRDGQQVHTVQYGVHDRLSGGGDGYTDAGFIFTMNENLVSAIRAYGLNSRVSAEDVYGVVNDLILQGMETGYSQVPFSFDGAQLDKFDADDLIFSGIDLLASTPDTLHAVLGDPMSDEWMDDGEYGYTRTLVYKNCEIVFQYDVYKANPKMYMLLITEDTMEGPRCVRIGDSFASVLNRFRNGEGENDESGDGMTEMLYGTLDGSEFGEAQYGAITTLRYGLTLEDGTKVVLHLTFNMTRLTEIMLYTA